MKNIIIPIHVTHAADMDGVGCALLTKYVFDNDEISTINPYTGEKLESIWAKPLIIPVGNNVTDIMDELEKLRSNKNANVDNFEYMVKEYGRYSIPTRIERKIIFLIIFTDINLPDDSYIKLREYATNLMIAGDDTEHNHFLFDFALWEFDHHKTNQNYVESLSYENNCIVDLPYENAYSEWFGIPSSVSIVSSYMSKLKYEFQPFLKCVYQPTIYNGNSVSVSTILETRKSIEQELNLLCMDGKSQSTAERSATYFYFMFLHNLHVFDTCKYKQIRRIILSVFHISNYDTFEFSKEHPAIPEDFVVDNPDRFTIYFKYICNGDFFKALENLDERLVAGTDEIPSFDYYPFYKDDISLIDYEYEKRRNQLKSMINKAFVITANEFCSNMQIDLKGSGLKANDYVAIITYPVDDPSYVGNTIVNEYCVKIVVMLYPDSRIVSFRSNNKDEKPIDCSVIARKLDGGGHMFAAGCKLDEANAIRLLRLGWESDKKQLKDFINYDGPCTCEEES